MKIHNFVLVGMALWQLSFAVCADEDIQAKNGRSATSIIFPIVSLAGIFLGSSQAGKNRGYFLRKDVIGDGGFISGNFVFPPIRESNILGNNFFSASIGYFSINKYREFNGFYELQLELEYLQDVSISDSEEVNSLKALLYNSNIHLVEDTDIPLYVSFGAGGGKLDLLSLVEPDAQLDGTGFISQLRIGTGPLLTRKFRINFGYRGIVFHSSTYTAVFHRFEAGGEYKW